MKLQYSTFFKWLICGGSLLVFDLIILFFLNLTSFQNQAYCIAYSK